MKVLLITCILFYYIYFDAFLTSDYSSTTVNRNLVGSGCMLTDQKKKTTLGKQDEHCCRGGNMSLNP